MRNRYHIIYSVITVAMLIGTSQVSTATKDIAIVLKVNGDAKIKSTTSDWQSLKKGARLQSGDRIRTGSESLVAVVFSDDKTMMKIRSESELSINGDRTEKGIAKRLAMNIGQMWDRVTPGTDFRLETPSGVAAVKGTEFYGIVDAEGNLSIVGIDGLIELLNELGAILVEKGKTGILKKGIRPILDNTKQFEDWARLDSDENELMIEFENSEGTKKQLKIRFRK